MSVGAVDCSATHCVLQQHHLVLQVHLKGKAAISWPPQRVEPLHQGVLVVAIGKGKTAIACQDCEGHLQQGSVCVNRSATRWGHDEMQMTRGSYTA